MLFESMLYVIGIAYVTLSPAPPAPAAGAERPSLRLDYELRMGNRP